MIRKILFALFIIAAVLYSTGYFFLRSDLPHYDGQLLLNGLKGEVRVVFDDHAIPHIYAENEEDAYRALGYVHASERLFQMEMARRVASGMLAELLGEKLVKTDVFFRTIGIRRMAERSAARLQEMKGSQILKSALAYLDGVNQFVDNGKMSVEFKILGIPKRHFDLVDVYAIIGYTTFGFSNAIHQEPVVSRLMAKYGEPYMKDWNIDPKNVPSDTLTLTQRKAIFDLFAEMQQRSPYPVRFGSNSWVVAPKRSKYGKVILANDTHIFFAQPSTWYEAHIEYPGLNFYGNHLAGVPFAFIGHNQAVAWGLTIFPTDNMDMYYEKVNPEDPAEVWVDDHWEKTLEIHETVRVKDTADTTFTIRITRHGPLISSLLPEPYGEKAVSLRWVNNEMPTTTLEAAYSLDHATNIDDARNAAKLIDVLGLNVMYGDTEGNIAWWASGKISKRPPHVNSKVILDGASGKDELLGYFDFEENPHSENPESGVLYSANERPAPVNGYHIPGYYTPNTRAKRIRRFLMGKERFDMEDFKRMHRDVLSESDRDIAHFFAAQLGPLVSDEERTGLELMAAWDGDYQKGDNTPLLYTKMQYYMLEYGIRDELGEEDFDAIANSYLIKRTIIDLFVNMNSLWWDDVTTDEKETYHDILLKSYRRSMADLKEQFGDEPSKWKWEKVHTLTHVHPIGRQAPFDKLFNVGPFPMPGTNAVLNKQGFRLTAGGHYDIFIGPALRIIHDFSQPENSVSINPTGQSGHVMSKYYDDQAELYNAGLYRKQMTDKEEIQQKSIGTLTLIPAQ